MKGHTMKPSVKRLFLPLVCGALATVTLTSCYNVADIGTPIPTEATTVTTDATTVPSASTATTAATTLGTTAPTAAPPAVQTVTERRSPGVTYFVPASAAVSPDFFRDAVIVGDSITLKLSYYNIAHSTFPGATFLTSGSLGVTNAMWDLNREDAVHPSYQGQTVTVVDGIARSGAKKVYLMLGTNDLGMYGVDGTLENFKILTDKIVSENPQVTMYIQSVTPIYDTLGSLTNERINDYNKKLSEYCREKGWYFVDVASVLRNDSGSLPSEYCSDPDSMGIHFTDTACQLWADYLYTHTA